MPLLTASKSTTPIIIIPPKEYSTWLKKQSSAVAAWLKASRFEAKDKAFRLIPDASGMPLCVLQIAENIGVYTLAHLPKALPAGTYRIEGKLKPQQATQLALGWELGSYRFTRYKKSSAALAQLVAPKAADLKELQALTEANSLARDLINTPANDMHPEALAAAALNVTKRFKAQAKVIVGEALLKANYPLVYAVGKASAVAPRLVDIRFGNPKHPKVTLVGKGVCFDSGGLDIKPSSAMRLMKKDMGGAAVMLGLAQVIMAMKLPVRLRVLLPIVENAIAGNAMRPSDIVTSRKGITVEIGNTDAEGRLILCDALFEADSEKPELLIDAATLTGAARVALGTDIPALFTKDDVLATTLHTLSAQEEDPLYRLPLHTPYRELLNSKIADICNDPETGQGGAITAALFLHEFVSHAKAYVHLDMMAWNIKESAGKPAGGEAQCLRTLYAYLKQRYGK